MFLQLNQTKFVFLRFGFLCYSVWLLLTVVRLCNAVVIYQVKLFQNYFSLHRRPSEIILYQRVETCLKLFQNYFRVLLQLIHIFQHVRAMSLK